MSDQIFINQTPIENTIVVNTTNNSNNIGINTSGSLVLSVNGRVGAVILTSFDVGLGNVNNTSDWDKPLSYATLTALALKTDLSLYYTLNDLVTSNYQSWQDATYTINALSGNWDSAYNTVNSLSGYWQAPHDRLSNGTIQVILSSDNLLHFPTGVVGDILQDGGFNIVGNSGSYAELASNDGNVYAWVADTNYGNPYGGGFAIGTNTLGQGHLWSFRNDGLFYFPDGSTQTTAYTGIPSDLATVGFVENNFLYLSGGIISGSLLVDNNLTVWGNISASGNLIYANTYYSTVSALCAIANSAAPYPGLYVSQSGTGNIADFYDASSNQMVLQIGTSIGNPNVGIYTSNPNEALTVVGNISANGYIYDNFGNSSEWNTAYSLVSGGIPNSSPYQTGSGYNSIQTVTGFNSASGDYSVVAGGQCNYAQAYSSVLGGYCNCALNGTEFGSNELYYNGSTVSGGYCNTASGYYDGGFIGGGSYNCALKGGGVGVGRSNKTFYEGSFIGGGGYNTASGYCSFIGAGGSNCIDSGCSFIGSGYSNTVSNYSSFIGAGTENQNSGCMSSIVGGLINCIGATSFVCAIYIYGVDNCYLNNNGNYCRNSGGATTFCNTGSNPESTVYWNGSCWIATDQNGADYLYNTAFNLNNGHDSWFCVANNLVGSCYGDYYSYTHNADYSFIGGGQNNCVNQNYSTITGGCNNIVDSPYSIIGGGLNNCMNTMGTGIGSVIGGGGCNSNLSCYAVIGGGQCNCINGTCYNSIGGGFSNTASLTGSNVSGGVCNIAAGEYSAIGGGMCNTIGNNSFICAISLEGVTDCNSNTFSGYYQRSIQGNTSITSVGDACFCGANGNIFYCNTASAWYYYENGVGVQLCNNNNLAAGNWAPICGAISISNVSNNCGTSVYSGFLSTIGGGGHNSTIGCWQTIGGGGGNTASAYYGAGTIAGGFLNTVSGYFGATVGGGTFNCSSGLGSVIAGGCENSLSGYFSSIVGGAQNSSQGFASFIAGGCRNNDCCNNNVFILGSDICATQPNTTYTNNIISTGNVCAQYFYGNGSNLTGISSLYPYTSGSLINSIKPAFGCNSSDGSFAVVSGGCCNTASGYISNIVSGFCNVASGEYSFVGNGFCNTADNIYTTVVNGELNCAGACKATVGGGGHNCATGQYSVIAGGGHHCASGRHSAIIGGRCNTASEFYSTVAGGHINTASAYASTIGGGQDNCVTGLYAVIAGGYNNCAYNSWSTVGGGSYNCAVEHHSTVSGGYCNVASGAYSAILGGCSNNDCANSNVFILGSGICATQANTTFVNNLNSQCNIAACNQIQYLNNSGCVSVYQCYNSSTNSLDTVFN